MCTTRKFKPPEKDKITLPESNSEAKSPESNIITIAVTSPRPELGGKSHVRVIYRQRGEEVSRDIPADQVSTDMSAVLSNARAANPMAYIIVKMDKDAPYGVMADMMQGLQDAKAPRFNVQTDLEGSSGLFNKKAAKP
jgi:biopolymer transport protein ExbD